MTTKNMKIKKYTKTSEKKKIIAFENVHGVVWRVWCVKIHSNFPTNFVGK